MEERNWPRVAVIGAGAVGCFYGGMLARAGAPVTLIGRRSQVAAIRAHGLLLESGGTRQAIALEASTDAAAVSGAEVLLVCVKTPDTEAAARDVRPHLAAGARVMSLQNGVDNARRLRAVLSQPIFAAVVYVGAVVDGPGEVRHTGRGELVLGALRDDSQRDPEGAVRELAAMFRAAGIGCEVVENVEAELWRKLAINCVFNAISALAGARYGPMMRNASIRALVPDILAEVCAVAAADGIALDHEALLQASSRIAESMSDQISSTAQDVLRGKPTEIDALNGYVVQRAAAHGIAAPLNRVLHALVKLREQSAATAR